MPSTVKRIGEFAFNGCNRLNLIELNEGLKSISKGAFYKTPVSSITIPSTVENIGDYAFRDCINLQFINCEIKRNYYKRNVWNFIGLMIFESEGKINWLNG